MSYRTKDFQRFVEELKLYNIAEVANLSGVTTTAIYMWINGKTIMPRLTTLSKVVKVIDYPYVIDLNEV